MHHWFLAGSNKSTNLSISLIIRHGTNRVVGCVASDAPGVVQGHRSLAAALARAVRNPLEGRVKEPLEPPHTGGVRHSLGVDRRSPGVEPHTPAADFDLRSQANPSEGCCCIEHWLVVHAVLT